METLQAASTRIAKRATHWMQKIPLGFGIFALVLLACSQTSQGAAYFTTTNVDSGTPGSWTGDTDVDWQTNTAIVRPGTPATTIGPKLSLSTLGSAGQIGSTFELIGNGKAITNSTAVTVPLLRTPSAASVFPGFSLTIDTNTILFYKAVNGQVDTYTNLILQGGVVCQAQGNAGGAPIITGAVQVVSQSYLGAGSTGNRVNGLPTVAETFNIAAALSGSGNLFYFDFLTNTPNVISGGTNNLGYHGTFIVQYGYLLGSNAYSLGTNSSVIIDPNSTLYKNDMPQVTMDVAPAGNAVFQVNYPYNTAGTLAITNSGLMILSQHCAFSAVTIEGTSLSAGNHLYSELTANFPNDFQSGGSDLTGSITVQPYNAGWTYSPPVIVKQPESQSVYSGGMVQFSVLANSASSYQWLSNGVPIVGATNTSLNYGSGSANVVAGTAYSVVMTNLDGPTTSSVVTVSIRTPTEPYEAAVAGLNPYAFYQFNETSNPASTPGGATAFDNANSLNGLYGTLAQNGFNGIAGPTPSAGWPGFTTTNTAFLPIYNNLSSTVTLPPLNLNTNAVTIIAWVNPNATQLSMAGLVMCRGNTTVAGLNYGSVFSSDYPLTYTWNNDPGTYTWNSGLYTPVNQWSLVALTVTPTNATIYVLNANGIASARHIYPHVVQSFGENTTIGGDSLSANRGFSGTIDDVAVFNHSLTLDQLSAMFYAASGVTNYAPIVVTPPASESVYPGQTASFSVSGGGSPPLTYQWQVDTGTGPTNITDGGNISGANGRTLNIIIATNSNVGNYYVVISNAWGTATGGPASLSLNFPAGPATNITMSVQEPNGASWDTSGYWIDGQGGLPASISAAEFPGSTYELLPGSRVRTPTTNSSAVFPGVQLTIDGNGVWTNNAGAGSLMGELRLKAQFQPNNLWSVTFPKLVMNGGQIDNAPDGSPLFLVGDMTLAGEVDIFSNAPIYNDGAGGDNLGIKVTAWLTGGGSVEYHGDTTGSIPFSSLTNNLNIANATNTFTGAWKIVSGILLGSAPGSLGTNTITIGSATSTNAALETDYDLQNTNGSLVIYGQVFLHQNDTFKSVFINGVPLTSGTYSFATLNSTYPSNFPSVWALQNGSTTNSGSGQIIVLTTPVPLITAQPQPVSVYPGQSAATFSVTAVGNLPLYYQWYTNGTTALADNANRVGSTSNVLVIPNPTSADAGNYTVVVTNTFGSVTSSVAALTILTPGPATNFTLNFNGTPVVEGVGSDWNTVNSWNPFGQPASTSAYANPGSTFELVVGSRLRTPAGTISNIFPASLLTIDGAGNFENTGNNTPVTVSELRFKNNNAASTNYFTQLVLNGGELDLGDNTLEDIQGQLTVATNSVIYVDSSAANDRGYQIDAQLTGTGTLLWHQFSGSLGGSDLLITDPANTFNGQWIVDQGALVGVGINSLGTNSIFVGTNGLTAALETTYNVNDTGGSLVLGATGSLFLHQNDHFASVVVNGSALANGIYSFATLNSLYPANFPTTWTLQNGSTVTNGSGQIIVGNAAPSSPHITGISVTGTSLSISATNGSPGGSWTLLQSTKLTVPLSQWQTNTAGSFDGSGNLSTNLVNTATNVQEFYILKAQ
jgi:hypothetical protein